MINRDAIKRKWVLVCGVFIFFILFLVFVCLMYAGSLTPVEKLAKIRCLATRHHWVYITSEKWIWTYYPKGSNYENGLKYRIKPNVVRCNRCPTVLFDKRQTELMIYPMAKGEKPVDTTSLIKSMPVKNVKNGVAKNYYKNGAVMNEWRFHHGKLNGLSKDYFSDGQLKNEWVTKNDKMHGPAKGYHANGLLRWQDTFKRGKPDGSSSIYYANGQPKRMYHYTNGLENGDAKIYYPTGNLEREMKYVHGKVEGVRKDYYRNGALKKIRPYRHSKLNGLLQEFWPNGKNRFERKYIDNLEVERREYDVNEDLKVVINPNILGYRELVERQIRIFSEDR